MSPQDHWDVIAPRYDAATALLERRFLARGRRWVGARARGRVLEVGIGTGANLAHLPPEVRLTGVDTSPAMLRVARSKVGPPDAASTPGPTEVDLLVADAGDLPFGDGEFDTVLATYVLCNVPDLRVALVEALRVLRPGGDLLLSDHVVSTSRPVRLAQRALEAVCGPAAEEHFTRRPLDTLHELGVEVVASERHTLGVMEAVHARRPG